MSKIPISDQMVLAMKLYAEEDYSCSLKFFQKIIIKSEDETQKLAAEKYIKLCLSKLIDLAIKLFNEGNYSSSLKNFEIIIDEIEDEQKSKVEDYIKSCQSKQMAS